MCSESVLPTIWGYNSGSIASTTSRFICAKPLMNPLWTNSVLACRNGWQFDCCTGEPIAARTWAIQAETRAFG